MKRLSCVAFVAIFGLAVCAAEEPAAPAKTPLYCYVGGTMRPAMEELAKLYKEKSGMDVQIDAADSGECLIKIEKTKRGDLYVCHDPFLGSLMKKGLGEQGWTMAALTPMIAVPKGNPKKIQGLEDLAKPGVRVALTDAEFSTTGHILEVIYRKSGLKEKIEPNVVTRTRGGGEAANAVVLGAADAAIVWNAVIFLRKDKLDMVDIKAEWRPVRGVDAVTTATYGKLDMDYARVTIATLKCSTQLPAAKAFAEFCASAAGKEVFAKQGFTPADPARDAPAEGK